MPPAAGCPTTGLAYPEVTRAICLVPSASFSQAPWYALPVHLCRFRVRSIRWSCFLERSQSRDNPISPDNSSRPSLPAGWGVLTPFPSATAFALALGARLTLRGLTLRRNPWTYGDRVSHSVDRYSCQHSRFRYLQHTLRCTFTGLRNAPLPRTKNSVLRTSAASVRGFSPVTFSARDNLSRPVSYYAFFKGWLLLSQPPGCLCYPTSFPT